MRSLASINQATEFCRLIFEHNPLTYSAKRHYQTNASHLSLFWKSSTRNRKCCRDEDVTSYTNDSFIKRTAHRHLAAEAVCLFLTHQVAWATYRSAVFNMASCIVNVYVLSKWGTLELFNIFYQVSENCMHWFKPCLPNRKNNKHLTPNIHATLFFSIFFDLI